MKKTFKLLVSHSSQVMGAADQHFDVADNRDVILALTEMIERFSLAHGPASLVDDDVTIHLNTDSFLPRCPESE